jgi:hypothetical protein
VKSAGDIHSRGFGAEFPLKAALRCVTCSNPKTNGSSSQTALLEGRRGVLRTLSARTGSLAPSMSAGSSCRQTESSIIAVLERDFLSELPHRRVTLTTPLQAILALRQATERVGRTTRDRGLSWRDTRTRDHRIKSPISQFTKGNCHWSNAPKPGPSPNLNRRGRYAHPPTAESHSEHQIVVRSLAAHRVLQPSPPLPEAHPGSSCLCGVCSNWRERGPGSGFGGVVAGKGSEFGGAHRFDRPIDACELAQGLENTPQRRVSLESNERKFLSFCIRMRMFPGNDRSWPKAVVQVLTLRPAACDP